ncbi:MAG: hypothetical protein K6F50_06105 [Kiritimatiellae bacterium]|nr:hypothetical protein [Kiritimatiellia bacterium]
MGRVLSMLAAAALLSGCSTFRLVQEDMFVDGDGLVLTARYGELSRPYTYEIVSPVNGAVLECTDRSVVELVLPEPSGEEIMCYICQKIAGKGTMYMTRDRKWKYWTIGTMSRLYLINEAGDDYLLVFEGRFFQSGDDEKGSGR